MSYTHQHTSPTLAKLDTMFSYYDSEIRIRRQDDHQINIRQNMRRTYPLNLLAGRVWNTLKEECPWLDIVRIHNADIKSEESCECVRWFAMEGFDVCLLNCKVDTNRLKLVMDGLKDYPHKVGKVMYWDGTTSNWVDL